MLKPDPPRLMARLRTLNAPTLVRIQRGEPTTERLMAIRDKIIEAFRGMRIKPEDLFYNKEKAMKTYIGIKRVEAEEATALFAIDDNPEGGTVERNGYRVKYDDGYTSWSPREAFETAYVEVPHGEAQLILAKLRGDLAVLVEHPPELEAWPDDFGRPTAEEEARWHEEERAERAESRRSQAIAYALQATTPAVSMQGMERPRTVGQVIDAATKILDFIEGRASLAPTDPAP